VSRRATTVAVAVALLAMAGAAIAAAESRWDTRVLALIPRPGFPAKAYVAPNGRIYEGTYDNPSGDTVRSRVLEYTGDGTLQRSWTIAGQDLSQPHGVQVATSDSRGRLLLLDKSPARALLLNTRTGAQTVYATFADLPSCAPTQTAPNCAPSLRDQPAIPNYAAWGPDGSLYVTDYGQAVIWRVPPGGGEAKVWLADRLLDGDMFGTTGIALAPDRSTLLVAQSSSAGLGDGNPATGKLYAVDIRGDGQPGTLRQLWESGPADAPDGFAIAQSGRIYIALTGTNQLGVLSPQGQEIERFPSQPQTGDNGSSIPFDNPSSVAFLGKRLIVANQSYISGDATHQALLSVYAGEDGLPELIPGLKKRRKHHHRHRHHHHRHRHHARHTHA
jgi:sugar lactone lactonase YvrE